jgi:hypothetical protein
VGPQSELEKVMKISTQDLLIGLLALAAALIIAGITG